MSLPFGGVAVLVSPNHAECAYQEIYFKWNEGTSWQFDDTGKAAPEVEQPVNRKALLDIVGK